MRHRWRGGAPRALVLVLYVVLQAGLALCFSCPELGRGASCAKARLMQQQQQQARLGDGGAAAGSAVGASSTRGALYMTGMEPRPKVMAVSNSMNMFKGRFVIMDATRQDMEVVSKLCVDVFFGVSDKQSPWKAAQFRQLYEEQLSDLGSRVSRLRESAMFKAIDTKRGNEVVGFIEVSLLPGTKYGMGSNIPEATVRPVISNLAVVPRVRRFGIGSSLLRACEEQVGAWGYAELVLQVEEDNVRARAFYERMGFDTLFVDRAARRYDTSGFLLQNVRCSKLTLRKLLPQAVSSRAQPQQGYDQAPPGVRLVAFLERFLKGPPSAMRPPTRQ